MTVREAAARLEVSESLIYRLCATGQLPHRRIGTRRGTIRIDAEDLTALSEACRREKPPETGSPATPVPIRPATGRLDGQPFRYLRTPGPARDRKPRPDRDG
jgi:excisionase family DNA binding protein